MKDRITLIALFKDDDITKIEQSINIDKNELCKVPYIDNISNRKLADTLPYHFTFCAWDALYEEHIVNNLKNIKFVPNEILINDIEIMSRPNGSYVLYLNSIVDESTKLYQKDVYNIMPVEKYNPDKINFHITIHVDKDYKKVKEMKEQIDFKPFKVRIENAALFKIYPAELIEKY